MTREDLALAVSQLGPGSIQVISADALAEAFGRNVRAEAGALAAEYGCEFHVDEDNGEGTFERPLAPGAARWADHEKAIAPGDPGGTPDNAIGERDQREHRVGRGDAARRPLEMGGEAENPHPREGSETDPDAG